MKPHHFLFLVLILLSDSCAKCLAQESSNDTILHVLTVNGSHQSKLQEKVYLHFDNTAYFRGETIWFAATVVNATNLGEAASKVLYVELLSPTGVVLKQQKLKIVDGRCHGSLPLVDNDVERAVELRGAVPYPSGFYEVRAYTRAMLGYDESCVFSRVFPVYQSPEEEGDFSNPLIAAYPGREFDRPEVKRPRRSGKLDLSFYPEGGHILAGEPCRVAFKITDEHGLGVCADSICDSRGRRLDVDFQHKGMGAFMYHPDRSNEKITVYANGRKATSSLPESEPKGFSLRFWMENGQVMFTIHGHAPLNFSPIAYTLTSKCSVCYEGKLHVRQTGNESVVDTTLVLPSQSIPTGVSQFSLYTNDGQVIAQRLLFVDNGNASMPVTVTAESSTPRPFGPITFHLQTPEPATFSLSVRDAADYGTTNSCDIQSYMLLSSELKGFIEDPAWYFGVAPEKERTAALDLLMMVQGWTRYDLPQKIDKKPDDKCYQPERDLVLDGWAFDRFSDKPVAGTKVGMKLFSPDRKYKQQAWATSDSTGYWRIHLADFNSDWDLYLYTQQKSKNPESVTTCLRLGRSLSPEVRPYQPEEMFIPGYAGDKKDLVVLKEERKDPLVQIIPDVVDIIGDSYLLDEVEIEGKRRYIDYNRFHAFNANDDSEQVLDKGEYTGDILAFLERKGYGYSIDYPDMDENIKDAYRLQDATKVSIDGHLTYWTAPIEHSSVHRHDNLPGTQANGLWAADMEDVKDIIVYDYEPGHRYVEVEITFLEENERKARVKNVRQTTFAGYSTPVEFYAPTYPNGPIQGDKDYRRTVYWNPEVTTDSTGCANVSFYNNGYSRSLTVSAEGLTKDGVPILNK